MKIKQNIRRVIKNLTGIDGISLFVKKQQKRVMKQIFKKKYTADDLINKMCEMGMKEGSVVFVHSSMTEFYNYTGTAEELIDKIIDVIGEEGTLMMPAYPKNKSKLLRSSGSITEVDFDVNTTPSGAGYLSEVFRTYPGVKRSINLQHSVCAVGKMASFLTSEHYLSVTAWDDKSPYYKMSQIETLVFAFGLPYFLGTMIHCTESILKDKYEFFSSFFTKEFTYTFIDENQKRGIHKQLTHEFKRTRSKKRIIKKYFDKNQFHTSRISNLRIEMVDAKYTLDLYLSLAERGITMYSKPSPKLYITNGVFIKKNEQ